MKKTIAILFGGLSAEYSVSLASTYAVITHFPVKEYNLVLLGITQAGQWFHYQGPAEKIKNDTWSAPEYCSPAFISPCRFCRGIVELVTDGHNIIPVHAAFPVMHGTFGEDGTMQGLLELAGIPIIGCGTQASALCMDKVRAHQLVHDCGVCVPASFTFKKSSAFEQMEQAAQILKYPVFVKPVKAGSSYGISKVKGKPALCAAVEKAFQYDDVIVFEEAIEGFEVGCAILGKEELTIGEVDEIELSDGFFDFEEKYNLVTSQIHVPARITAQTSAYSKETAALIYKALGCSGFARVDLFLKPDGTLVFNEVNTIPGFTPHSRYPNMMQQVGLSFEVLLKKLIETAVAS